jgi:RNA polymerase sigma-70 factor (ECF subfamily)
MTQGHATLSNGTHPRGFHKIGSYWVLINDEPIEEVIVPSINEFDSVVDMYSGEIFTYLWRLLNGHTDAEDCLQEVFLRAFKAFDRLEQGANVRAWLYKIAINTSISFRKKRNRVDSHELIVDFDIPAAALLPEDRVARKERLKALVEAINALPEQQRSALILRKYQELSYAEISEILNCSQDAARANVYQAVKKLRARYSKKEKSLE